MHKRHIFLAGLGLALVPAMAPALAWADSLDSVATVIVTPGQGRVFTVDVPVVEQVGPYALTGSEMAPPTHEVARVFGQGMAVLIRVPD